MFSLLATAAALLIPAGDPPAAQDDTQQAYRAAKAAAGRTPDEQVRLAYWCEAHGLPAERLRHLAQAVLADPDHAAARGLLGLVARGDRWMRPDAVASQVQADAGLAAKLKDYDQRRAATPYTAEGQWRLARWADEQGLAAQARAHYTAVTRLDPGRELAWKRLGYKRQDGRWTTDAEVAAARADAEAQQAADRKWRPLLERWKTQLRKPATRDEAEAGLLGVTDPLAVPGVVATFLAKQPTTERLALQILGQIDSAGASRNIAGLAVMSADAEVRRAATETLRRRDPREFAAMLIGPIRERVEYQIQQVGGPGTTGRLVFKEPKRKVERLYVTPGVPSDLVELWQISGGAPTLSYGFEHDPLVSRERVISSRQMSYDAFLDFKPTDPAMAGPVQQAQQAAPTILHDFLRGKPHNTAVEAANPANYRHNIFGFDVRELQSTSTPLRTQTSFPLAAMIAEYQKTAAFAQQQLIRDAATIDAYNRQVDERNERLTSVLRAVSGEDHGVDAMSWKAWLVNLSGYAMINESQADVPTVTINVPLAYEPQAIPIPQATIATGPAVSQVGYQITPTSKIASCFGAGTLVRTMTGPRPIETLRPGDLALAQEIETGALRYQPILNVHHNPPSPTFLIKIAGETIVSSPFHRFWKVAHGWIMARDIVAGDRLRILSGTALVEDFQVGKVELVYNLDINDDADFFVGSAAALVHDNSLPNPRLIPFDLATIGHAKGGGTDR